VSCPFFPGNAARIHRSVRDPAKAGGTSEQILSEFRKVRDEIMKKVDKFFPKSL
jgi:arsenate reductase